MTGSRNARNKLSNSSLSLFLIPFRAPLLRLPDADPENVSIIDWNGPNYSTSEVSIVRGSSHLASQVERSNPKFLSRGEGRSSLTYIISVLLSDFEYFIEKKNWPLD